MAFEVPARGKYHGVRQIFRYNWPFYAAASVSLALLPALLLTLDVKPVVRLALSAAVGVAAFWTISSLAVSHYVYDRAPLNRWIWLRDLLPAAPAAWVNIHAGHDETNGAIDRIFRSPRSVTLDIYDAGQMSEPSIKRARQAAAAAAAAPGAVPASFGALPVRDEICEAVFLIFAAHEVRRPAAREKFFEELRRVLVAGGRVVVVEHLRDSANFAAYGPGFLHFLPAAEWRRLAARANFVVERETRMTPFVAIFVLRKDG